MPHSPQVISSHSYSFIFTFDLPLSCISHYFCAISCLSRSIQDAIRAFLATDDLKEEVISEIQTWQQKVNGVPHFVIDGKHEFSGAQDTSFLLSVFKRIGVPVKNNL